MQYAKSALIKTLAPVLAGMLAQKLAELLNHHGAAAASPPSDDNQQTATPLVNISEVEQVISDATNEPALSDLFSPKRWNKSRGVVAGIAIAVLSFGGFFLNALSAEDVADIVGHLDKIIVGILGLLAAWGRIKARKAIS